MSRIIVEAVSGESKFIDIVFHLELYLSVTDAQTGAPVSGLTIDCFRVCSPLGALFDSAVVSAMESVWDNSQEGTGCYSVSISISKEGAKEKLEWIEGEYYPFGVQVRFADAHDGVHMGQTVVRIESLGK